MPSLKFKENGEWKTVIGGAGVTSFNARYGNVAPKAEDYAEFYPTHEEMDEAIAAIDNSAQISTHNTDETAHADIRSAISAVQTAADAAQITADSKADADHTHSGYASSSHTHSASDITSGTLPVSRGGTGNTSVDTTPTSGSTKMVTSGGVYTALSSKASSSHTQGASTITAGTLAGKVVANTSAVSSVATAQVRNIYAGTSDMTAGTTSLTTGNIYFVYE